MWRLIANLYSRRIVNVNVNISAAAVLALVPVLGVVKGYHTLGLNPHWLPAVTFLADVMVNVGIYFVLHFLANHAGRPFHISLKLPPLGVLFLKAPTKLGSGSKNK